MIREQNKFDSGIMIRGIITLIVLLTKEIGGYEIPNDIVDTVTTLLLGAYAMYSIGNSPRIKGEY